MGDARLLGCLVASAWACRRGHERDHRVADGFLNGVSGQAIEHHRIDDRLDDDIFVHQMPDRRGRVVVIASESNGKLLGPHPSGQG